MEIEQRDAFSQRPANLFPTACAFGAASDQSEMEVFPRHTITVVLDGVSGSAENVPRVTPTQSSTVLQIEWNDADLYITPSFDRDIVDKSMKRHESYMGVGTLYLRAMPVSIVNS